MLDRKVSEDRQILRKKFINLSTVNSSLLDKKVKQFKKMNVVQKKYIHLQRI